jgi:CRISPR/Cas system-associated exonuclease Cas4 (RecB family)
MDLDLPDLSQHPYLERVTAWSVIQAQKWAKANYRESYLNHEFGLVASEPETAKRDLSEQEAEEESLVEATVNEPEAEVGTESFNGRNGHPRDSRLKFYPVEHLYTLDGVPIAAVSNVVARFFPEYDAEYWSVRNGNRDGINPETLRKRWAENGERSRNLGTQLHQDIENYYLKGSRAEGADYELFQKFLADHPDLKPYRSEWRIFDDKYMVAGTLDLVVKTATGYDMYDWKRSKKVMDRFGAPITENKWASGIGPLSHLPDTSFNRYVLQQNIYRSFLEKHYGIKIDKMYLVVLHPNHSTYYKVEVPKRKEEVKALLEAVR